MSTSNLDKLRERIDESGLYVKPRLLQCLDCQQIGGLYMVTHTVWLEAIPDYRELVRQGFSHIYLCLQCLQVRLGRKLTLSDFMDARANELLFFGYELAQRERFDESVRHAQASGLIEVEELPCVPLPIR